MRIGIFDSGLGGLIIAKAIRKIMPQYDYVYLGDTKRVPYGNRSHETVFEFTKQAVDYLFRKENCVIIIIACNTASAQALKKIQQEYLLKNFPRQGRGEPDRKILGVLIPIAEECDKFKRVGILGTLGTIASNSFPMEIKKISKTIKIFQNSAPMLVPLAEEGEKILAKEFIVKYLKPFLGKKIEALVLGCTHYPFYKNEIRKFLACPPKPWRRWGEKIKVLSQDEIIPKKLKDYLLRHPEIEKKLAKNRKAKILVTDITKNIVKLSKKWFGKNTKPELIKL
ncbi:MAG: glutamate racemase [Patescibacteria group bacterium]